jgi:pimeloyl-ACP methyl ester carboxylesterase
MVTVRPSSSLPLLLLPGTLCDERVFAPLIARLANQPVLFADMTAATTTPDLAEQILRDAPDRFALLGFSLGGIVALEMIAQAPHRIAALALVDTTARPDPEANASVRRGAVERARAHGLASYIDDVWPDPVSTVNADRQDLRDLLVAMAERGGADVLASQTEVAIYRADSRPRLPSIDVPTLVLCGADDGICRPDLHREIADLIPDATLTVIPDAGHFALIERPDEVANHVRDWLSAAHASFDETTIA